jgi:hypothetical protein
MTARDGFGFGLVVTTGFGFAQPERTSAVSARTVIALMRLFDFLFTGSPEPINFIFTIS